jgi:hypothetical protein
VCAKLTDGVATDGASGSLERQPAATRSAQSERRKRVRVDDMNDPEDVDARHMPCPTFDWGAMIAPLSLLEQYGTVRSDPP